MENVLTLTGSIPGPTSMLLVGVHGDEVCGVRALEALLPELDLRKGKLFIAYGNPKALKQKVRFVEADLNRMFKPDDELSEMKRKTYEYARARYLQTYLDQADALLDVHASFTPDSRRFVIGERSAEGIMARLPFDLAVSGITGVQPGGTDYYMNARNKPGICVECGYLGDPESTVIARKAILSFLQVQGHIPGEPRLYDQVRVHAYRQYVTQTDGFVLTKPFADFEEVGSGELIGRDGGQEVLAPKDSLMLFARNRHKAGDEAFVLAEYEKAPA